jgi:uncharacterized membrane protein YesL
MVTNFLWIIFSIPIFTIGASTTASYYVMGKLLRGESSGVIKDFWKSFKMNFKQSTIVWLILLLAYMLVYFNIRNIGMLGSMRKIILPCQYVILVELLIITIYAFPLISRYYSSVKGIFKTALILGNMHVPTTVICIILFVGTGYLFYTMTGLFILLFAGFFIYTSSYFLRQVFLRHWPEQQEDEPEFTTTEL